MLGGSCCILAALARRYAPGDPRLGRMPQKGFMLRRRLRGRCAALALAACLAAFSPLSCRAQETPTVRSTPPQQIEPPPSQPQTNASSETDRYTLSHERYEKAVAYSRAGYALYFLSV